jgi:hypothetical protein
MSSFSPYSFSFLTRLLTSIISVHKVMGCTCFVCSAQSDSCKHKRTLCRLWKYEANRRWGRMKVFVGGFLESFFFLLLFWKFTTGVRFWYTFCAFWMSHSNGILAPYVAWLFVFMGGYRLNRCRNGYFRISIRNNRLNRLIHWFFSNTLPNFRLKWLIR